MARRLDDYKKIQLSYSGCQRLPTNMAYRRSDPTIFHASRLALTRTCLNCAPICLPRSRRIALRISDAEACIRDPNRTAHRSPSGPATAWYGLAFDSRGRTVEPRLM